MILYGDFSWNMYAQETHSITESMKSSKNEGMIYNELKRNYTYV